jgi:hypothetical protein
MTLEKRIDELEKAVARLADDSSQLLTLLTKIISNQEKEIKNLQLEIEANQFSRDLDDEAKRCQS